MQIADVSITIRENPDCRIKAKGSSDGIAYILIDNGPGTPSVWFHAHPENGVTAAQQLLTFVNEMRAAIVKVTDKEQPTHIEAAE